MYYPRTIQEQIKKHLKWFPVVILTGPRQVGKSTEVFRLTQEEYNYVSLDNIDDRQLALNDPKFFMSLHPAPLIIDEIQYAPHLLEVIEQIVNEKRIRDEDANGLFVLTGSQSFSLMNGVTQSLAGRAGILEMLPLSRSELERKEEKPFLPDLEHFQKEPETGDLSPLDLFERIMRGFYPELYKNPELPAQIYYENYLKTYLDRDVSSLINVTSQLQFQNFMQYLASVVSSTLNCHELSRALGIDYRTVKSWLSILQASGIIYLLQPYSEQKLTKRIVKSPKLYFCDTGLAAYLAKIYSAEHLMNSAQAGPFMENYVINEIRKSYLNTGTPVDLSFYRDNNQNEIDLVIRQNQSLYLIEIKKGITFNRSHVKGFAQLKSSALTIASGCILCNTQKNYALARDLYVLSCSVI